MDIRALVLVRTAEELLADPTPISQLPIGLLEVAGKSSLERITERLHRFGAQQVTVVSDFPVGPATNGDASSHVNTSRERFWRAAEDAFNDMAQEGAELVLMVSLDAYAEIDFEGLVKFHLDHQARVTQVCHANRTLNVFCISASRRNDAASLFRSELARCRTACPLFEHRNYFSPLAHARDLRQMGIDILSLRTETPPCGEQVRPGVWMKRGARLEKGARVLAPAFLGAFTLIRAHAVITRCSCVEHHAQVDLGTVIENSSILPYCRVGAGLDVAHSVVGPGTLANLSRDVTVEIADPKLIGYVAAGAYERFLKAAAEFITYLPKQVLHGALGRPGPQQPDLQTALRETSPSLGGAAGYQAPACDSTAATEKFPSNLAVVRRYGHE